MGRRIRGMGTIVVLMAVGAALISATPAQAARKKSKNLVVNPGFEKTHLPSDVMNLQKQAGINQPVLPLGWIFEGSTELFDHTPNTRHSGQYSAGISGSWSGPRRDCSVQCVDVPGGQQRNTVYGNAYSLAPAWRTQDPIRVTGGKKYTLSYWVKMSIVMDYTGAMSRVRWLDANGVPIGYSNGPSKIAKCGGANYATFVLGTGTFDDGCHTRDWGLVKGSVTAPRGAKSAVLLLGYSDSAWIGQVIYDDVVFSLIR